MASGRTGHELDDKGGAPEGGFDGAGRPKEGGKYGKDSGARGRDPLGAHKMRKDGSANLKYGKKLALAHVEKLKNNLINNNDYKLINESEEIEKEYKDEVDK